MKKCLFIFVVLFTYVGLFSQTCQWAEKIAGTSDDYGYSVATDADGNIYVCGNFTSSTLTLNNGKTLNSSGGYDAYIAKYNSSGICQWAEKIAGSSNDFAFSIAVDGNGNVYVAGNWNGNSTLTFNNGKTLSNTTTSSDAYIAKYNSSGVCQWTEKIAGSSHENVQSIVLDGSGNICLTGSFQSSQLTFNNGKTLTNSGSSDVFITKYNNSGLCQWVEKIAGYGVDAASSIAVDGSGNFYLSGYFSSSTIILNNGRTLTNSGSTDAYLTKYNSNGICQWAEKIAGFSEDNASSIAVDGSGNVYLTGYFISSTLTLNNGKVLTNIGSNDSFIAKYNSNGVCQWADKIAGTSTESSFSIALDESGNAYISGYFSSSTLLFNNGKLLTNSGSDDGYFAKYNSDGICLGADKISGSSSDYARSIAIDKSGYLYITGSYSSSTLTFNNGKTLTNNGSSDAFIAKYDVIFPATIFTNGITNLTSNSAACGGNITYDCGGAITARGVCWSTNPNPTINDSKTTNGNGLGEFTSNITGLNPYTTYYVRAYATNSAGTSYGEQIRFAYKKKIFVKYDASGLNNGSSWTDAFTSLQTALSYATENSEIWVARGTYKPTIKVNGNSDRHKSFLMKKRISLIGGFSGTETAINQRNIANNPTILSGDIGVANDSTDNCYHIVTYQVGDNFFNDDLFDGFTIKYGNSNSSNPDNRGAAMILNNNGTPTIQNCSFENNFSGFRGGAVYNGETAVNFLNCKFTNNSATTEGGALFNYYAHYTTINNCEFSYNKSGSGGGLYCYYTDSLKIDSTLINFNSDGIFSKNGSIVISNCFINSNTKIGYESNYNNNSIFNSNFNNNQIGIKTEDFSNYKYTTILNSIVKDNTFYGMQFRSTVIKIQNCIVTGNNDAINIDYSSQNVPSSIIQSSLIAENKGTGIYLRTSTSGGGNVLISIKDCKIDRNYLGINLDNGDFLVQNSIISNNLITNLSRGGGILISGNGIKRIVNSTIANNTSKLGGGINVNGTTQIQNTILWGNVATIDGNEIYKESGSVTLENSCYGNGNGDIFGTITAVNCINTDPIFVDPNGEDYRVYGVSPCVDAGNDSFINEMYDIRGEGFYRKLDGEDADLVGTVDIGAYEYKHGTDKYLPPALTTPVLIEPANNDNNLGRIAQFKWRKVENATGYRIQISNTNTFAIRFIDQVETDTVVTITDLNPFMTQYWRVAALNQADSLWSVVWSFTTNDIDQPTVTTNSVTEIGLYSAVSGGNVTDDGDGIVTARGVCWATTSNPTIANNKTEDGTGEGGFVSDITGLIPNTPYYVRAYATNIAGTVYGSQKTFTTPSIIPPPSSWEFTSNTGNNSTIAVPMSIEPEMEDRFIQKNDAIGVFYKLNGVDKCAGYGLWNNENMVITVWGDDDQTSIKDGFSVNEMYNIKLWDALNGREYATEFTFSEGPDNYQIDGLSYLSTLKAELTITQSIPLKKGWNIISSNLHINQPDLMPDIWADLFSQLVIMKNNFGKIFIPNGVNQIGSWNLEHGYQVYTNQLCTLNINGMKVKPEINPIVLASGWNIISYLRNTPKDIAQCFATLTDRNSVTIAKNNAGKIFMPSLDINQIGSMLPGEGYQVYLNKVDTLVYPSNSAGRSSNSNKVDDFDARIIKTDFENTGNNASLILDVDLADNTELAVMNNDNKIVGTGRVVDGRTAIVIWGDDEEITNHELRIMNYDAENGKYTEIDNLDLTDIITSTKYNKLTYNKDAVLIGKALTQPISLKVNPNPFSNSTEVIFTIADDCEIELSLYNLSGMKVIDIANGKQSKGIHKLTINSENLSSGTYNVILKSCGKSVVEKVVVVK